MLKPKDKHLSPQEVALCAEAIMEKRFQSLPDELKAHLQECEICSAEVAMVAEITHPVEDVTPEPRRRIDIKHPAIPFLVAAILLGLIILVVFPLINNYNDERKTGLNDQDTPLITDAENIPSTDDSPGAVDDAGSDKDDNATSPGSPPGGRSSELLLAEFKPNLELEILVANFQSAYRGAGIVVTTGSSIAFPGETSLKWENPRKVMLIVELFDNEGNEIVSASTDGGSFTIPQLNPGLYYWKLIEESDFDLIFAGRIIYQP